MGDDEEVIKEENIDPLSDFEKAAVYWLSTYNILTPPHFLVVPKRLRLFNP